MESTQSYDYVARCTFLRRHRTQLLNEWLTMPTSAKHDLTRLVAHNPATALSAELGLHLLFVHRDGGCVESCLREFDAADFRVTGNVVTTPERFIKQLDGKYYDLVLAEFPTLNWRGPSPLDILGARARKIPLIYLTQTLALEQVAELITEGAADCVDRDHLGHLPIAIRRALRENHLRDERDQTEKKLRHSESRYRALVGNLTYGMFSCDKNGNFLEVNAALVTMLGFSSKFELVNARHVREILCDASKREQFLGNPRMNNAQGPVEVDLRRKDGTPLRVQLSGRAVHLQGAADTYEIIVQDVTQQRKLEDHLRQQAAKDSLTGLANYRRLVEIIDGELKRSERTGREFAILFLDLDGLKKINDAFGHLVGSQALCRLADVLSNCARDMDTAARFGGDEFAIVLPETGVESANVVARRIRQSLARDDKKPNLSVSIGVAVYPRDGTSIETILSAADKALYLRKSRAHSRERKASGTSGSIRVKATAG